MTLKSSSCLVAIIEVWNDNDKYLKSHDFFKYKVYLYLVMRIDIDKIILKQICFSANIYYLCF